MDFHYSLYRNEKQKTTEEKQQNNTETKPQIVFFFLKKYYSTLIFGLKVGKKFTRDLIWEKMSLLIHHHQLEQTVID